MIKTCAVDSVPFNAGNRRLLFAWLVAVVFFATWLVCLHALVGTPREYIVGATLLTALFVAVVLFMARVAKALFVLGSVALALLRSSAPCVPEETEPPQAG